MKTYKFEYIWLDGYEPLPHIRSKTAIRQLESFDGKAESLSEWSFVTALHDIHRITV